MSEIETINFVLFFSSMNFCYWGEPKWTIEYNGKSYDGAWGMIASLFKAYGENLPIFDVDFISNLTKDNLRKILRGNIEIPLFDERYNSLVQVGKVLKEKFGGDFRNLIKETNYDVIMMQEMIINNFSYFNDSSNYCGNKVFFNKRVQLIFSCLNFLFDGNGYGNLLNLKYLTASADYKIPQNLRKIGILEYEISLAERIDNKVLIEYGSLEETEIRSNMIWAVELIRQRLSLKYPEILAKDIDSFLWLQGQNKSKDDKPYHLTKTIFY